MSENITSTTSFPDEFFDEDESTEEDINVISDENLRNLMNINYTYPEPDDKNLQEKVYRKREFYYNHMPKRPKFKSYEEIRDYREDICVSSKGLLPQQAFLANYINPDTPYKGILVFHGLGSGKTSSSLIIKEFLLVNF